MTIVDIRYSPLGLQIKRFGCCEWETIGAVAGYVPPVVTSPDVASQSLSEWLENGGTLPPITFEPKPPSDHTTDDSIRCAKATAMQDGYFLLLGKINEVLRDLPFAQATLPQAVASVGAILLSMPYIAILGAAGAIIAAIADVGSQDLIDEIDSLSANTNLRSLLICETVPLMDNGTIITENDVRDFIGTAENVLATSSALNTIFKAFSVSYVRDYMQQFVPNTPCGCEQYLPYSYTPPQLPGFRIEFDKLGRATDDLGNLKSPAGLPFEGFVTSPQHGSLVNGLPRTTYATTTAGWYETWFAAMFKATDAFTLNEVAVTVAYEPSEVGSILLYCYAYDNVTGLWELLGDNGKILDDNTSPIAISGMKAGASPDTTHILLIARARAVQTGGVVKYARMTDILFKGSYGGFGFVDLPVGVTFTP